MSNIFRKVSFQYELLDSNNQHKKWLNNVKSCSIDYKYLAQLKSSARISMVEDGSIDFLNDRIKVYMTLNGVQYALGVFLMCTPDRNITEVNITREIECYNLCQLLLDDKLESRLVLPIGTNVVNEVIRQIGSNYKIETSTKTLSSEKTYETGTSKLEVINDLLGVINYNSLRVDDNGYYVSEPYVLPTERNYDVVYEDNQDSIIISDMTDSLDLFFIPNVFVRYTNSLDVKAPLSYTYVNDNASSVTSTVNRGRRIVDAQSVEATDQSTLEAITKKQAYEYNSVYSHLNFQTAIDPTILNIFMPIVWVKVKHGNINDKYTITSIKFNCDVGELASLESRKVVNI